jgi:hypothetical protein
MRALTKNELSFVSGGFELGGPAPDKPVEKVTVPGKRKPEGKPGWNIIICDGDCLPDFTAVINNAVDEFFNWLNKLDENKPEITDANGDGKPGDTLNCPSGTAPALGAPIKDANGNVIRWQMTCAAVK